MAEVSHDTILQRVEQTELELAVLDTKVERVQLDITNIHADVKEFGEVSRETQTELKTLGRSLILTLSMIGLLFTALTFISRTI